MITIQIASNIQIDKIAFLEGAIIGDTMTDNFVDRCTARLWKTVIIEGRRICASLRGGEVTVGLVVLVVVRN